MGNVAIGCYSGKVYKDNEIPQECVFHISDRFLKEDQKENLDKFKRNAGRKCESCGKHCQAYIDANPITNKNDAITFFTTTNLSVGTILGDIIPAVHTAGFMEAKDTISIENDTELEELTIIEYANWLRIRNKKNSFEDHFIDVLIEKWGTDKQ